MGEATAPTPTASSSSSQWAMVRRLVRWKEFGVALVFFGSLVAGGVVTFMQLSAKPDAAAVEEAIDEAVDERVMPAVDLLLDEQAHQSDVLNCVAQPGCTHPPRRPPELDAKRRALMLRSKR